ncbi:MAG: HEAT repeat domain-containing protein, partial [Candidatus Hydrogenedentes bacterium]|nr:HEAT repeat domain-containing protein [Candidatus Hydrogenedentota bacterium]
MNIQSALNAELCVRLLTTLGHFVWQGALLGIVAALISVILKRRSATLRHNLYLAILCAMALCPVLTILAMGTGASPRQFDAAAMPAPNAQDETTPIAASPARAPEESAPVEIAAKPIHAGLEAAPVLPVDHSAEGSSAVWWRLDWRAYAPVVTAAYFAGVALLLIRLTVGLIGGGKLRRRSRPVTEGELLASLARGAESLGMRFAPALAFCEDVAVPTVVGVIRPMVLLPVAIASGFTPQQVEWLLLHELAHIRRWDHVINLFQRVVEAALFFHPAVWFVSNRIRVEREHCCDDVVVTLGGTAHEYAGALVTAAALCTGHGALARKSALAAVNKPRHLRARIERLLGGPGPSLRLGRGSWLAVAVVGVTAVLMFNVMASGTKADESASSGDESAAAASSAPVAEPAETPKAPLEDAAELLKLAQGEPAAPTPEATPDAPKPASAPAKPAVSKPDAEPAKDAKEASAEPEAPVVPSKSLVSDFDKLTPEVQELITQLDDPDWWLRKLAVQQLSEKNDPHAVTLLIPKLTDTDKRVQAAAAEALGKTADPRAIKHLVAVLEEKGDVANAAADALTHFPAEKVIPILRLAAADPDMRLGALNALARWDRPEVLEVLVSMLPSIMSAHQDNKVSALRFELARDFGKQLPDRVAEKLSEASKSPDAKIRIGVAELFAPAWQVRSQPETRSLDPASVVELLYQNPRAMDILTTLSNDPERDARAAAVDALGGVAAWDRNARRPPNAPALEALTKRLRDEDWSICAHAAKMLEAAGWQPSGPEDRAWSLVGLERPKDAASLGEAALEPLLHLLGSSRTNPYSFGGVSSRVTRPAKRGDPLLDDAIAALGEIKSQRAVPVLVELLKSEFETSAQRAARALAQVGGAAAADGLASALTASSEGVRWGCLD